MLEIGYKHDKMTFRDICIHTLQRQEKPTKLLTLAIVVVERQVIWLWTLAPNFPGHTCMPWTSGALHLAIVW